MVILICGRIQRGGWTSGYIYLAQTGEISALPASLFTHSNQSRGCRSNRHKGYERGGGLKSSRIPKRMKGEKREARRGSLRSDDGTSGLAESSSKARRVRSTLFNSTLKQTEG